MTPSDRKALEALVAQMAKEALHHGYCKDITRHGVDALELKPCSKKS